MNNWEAGTELSDWELDDYFGSTQNVIQELFHKVTSVAFHKVIERLKDSLRIEAEFFEGRLTVRLFWKDYFSGTEHDICSTTAKDIKAKDVEMAELMNDIIED